MYRMNIRNHWFGALLAIMLAASGAASAADGGKTRLGTIQQLDFGAGSMIVDGYRYHTSPELHVEIAGSYGAFTMLQVGMKVQIVYRVVSASQRDLVEVVQIPDNFVIDGV